MAIGIQRARINIQVTLELDWRDRKPLSLRSFAREEEKMLLPSPLITVPRTAITGAALLITIGNSTQEFRVVLVDFQRWERSIASCEV